MTTKTFNDNNFRIQEQEQKCKNCDDIRIYHPINLCYNYEPKFKEVKKEIMKPISWSNYFKSYFVEIKPEIKITYEPVYSEKCPEPYDSGKAYTTPNLTDYIGEISPNFPFNLPPPTPPPTPSPTPTVNWLNFSLDKLEYIMNGMWVDMTNYLLKNIKVFLTHIKYITENDIVQVNIQMKNQTYEI